MRETGREWIDRLKEREREIKKKKEREKKKNEHKSLEKKIS